MKRLFKVLLGLSVGAAIGMLFAPKSGKQLRQQLLGSATGKMLPAAPVEFPQPEHERDWGGSATAVAEPPAFEAGEAVIEETVIVEERVITDEGVVEDVVTIEERILTPEGEVLEETIVEEETLIVEEEAPVVEEPTEDTADLRTRIQETRAEVEASLAEPFGGVALSEVSVADEPVVEAPEVAETVVEETVVEEQPPVDVPANEATVEYAGPAEPAPAWTEEVVGAAALVAEEPVTPIAEAPVGAPRAWDVWLEEEGRGGDAEAAAVVEEAPAVVEEAAAVVAEAQEAPLEAVAPEPAAEEPAYVAPEPEEVVAEEVVAEEVVADAAPVFVADATIVEAPPAAAPESPVVAEEPAVVAEEPAVVAEEPAVVAEEPAVVAEEPAVVEEPAAATTGAIDQAEMRRRIEETRARLKAKAFDAMMSGEAALLGRDGEGRIPEPDEIKLDGDVESTIDESLSQEDY